MMSKPTHPKCFPLVPTKVSNEAAENVRVMALSIKLKLMLAKVGLDIHSRAAPKLQPNRVTRCQVTHRMLTCRSLRTGLPVDE